MTEKIKILLLGSGGREHALAWKMAQSPSVEKIYVLPGSDGISAVSKVECVTGDILSVAKEIQPSLVFVGPEKPLAEGIVDTLEKEGLTVLGPVKAAAQLETSKIFAKEFMTAEKIPTALFKVCRSYAEAVAALKIWDVEKKGIVIKADGLAAGKGVVVTHDRADAEKTLKDFMDNPIFPIKSPQVLLEEKLTGKEVSAFALCDGENFLTLGYACDYKRVNDGNEGANTGGMGGYAPQNWPSSAAKKFIEENIFAKTLSGMKKRGTPFKGILFAGLMMEGDDVHVIEFNVRFGDPETQILLPLIDTDVVPLFMAAAKGELKKITATVFPDKKTSVHVVMVSEGYPDTAAKGMRLGEIIVLPPSLAKGASNDNPLLFIAGAKQDKGAWINSGGRVLGVTALGATVEEARERAYQAISTIYFKGAHWRKDIGK